MNDGLALLYARVSTQLQANDGVSLDVQERTLRHAAKAAGYTNTEVIREEGRSGKSISGRPRLKNAIARLETGEASALFVTRIDRLARSTKDFLMIIDHAEKYKWRLVMLDLNLDTSSYSSRFVVTIMSALAEMERNIIAERQRDVHKDRRIRGKRWGVDLGPKPKTDQVLKERILAEVAAGVSYNEIARRLNKDEIKSSNGGRWYAATVKNVVDQDKRAKLTGSEESSL